MYFFLVITIIFDKPGNLKKRTFDWHKLTGHDNIRRYQELGLFVQAHTIYFSSIMFANTRLNVFIFYDI